MTEIASASSDARGVLGMDGVAPNLGDVRIAITVASASPTERVEAMLAAWRERCPIYLVLRDANEVAITTEITAPAAA